MTSNTSKFKNTKWSIQDQDGLCVLNLEAHMRIQSAVELHRALMQVVRAGKGVRVDASRSESIHTTILQILHSLSISVPSFEISNPSEAFLSALFRAGILFPTRAGNRVNDTIPLQDAAAPPIQSA